MLANHPVAPLPGQSQGMLSGAANPPVPLKPVEKVKSGLFMEMGDLIPTHIGLEKSARPKLKEHTCINICEWLQVFAVYMSVFGKKQPHRIPNLMGYQVFILDASNEYKNECWLAYMIGIFVNKLLQTSNASDQISAQLSEILLSLAKPEPVTVNTVSACFTGRETTS